MKLNIILIVVLFVFTVKGYAQSKSNTPIDNKEEVTQKLPQFPGGG